MPRKAKPLTPLAINKLQGQGLHFVGHVDGLGLHISPSGARSWILRAMVGGKRQDMGLGSLAEVGFAKAKEKALEYRELIKKGINPLTLKQEAKSALLAERANFLTFNAAAEQYIAAHESGWRNVKHAAQWRSTLEQYASPVLGEMHVKAIELGHILKVLEPIWGTKTETASRLRGRIESVLDWARVRGYRTGENPARWRGNLDALLPERRKVAAIKHHEAMPWHEVSSLWHKLQAGDGISARALSFVLLTACRSGEVRGARWEEIDLERRVWTIPATRMKMAKEHRVPLSPAALAILKSMEPQQAGVVFQNSKGTPLSDMALAMQLRRLNYACTVHGFRSTFRDWAGETSNFPREVIEHALAHQLKDKAEAAYARGDLFTKRTKLMEAWAGFVSMPKVKVENVTRLRTLGAQL